MSENELRDELQNQSSANNNVFDNETTMNMIHNTLDGDYESRKTDQNFSMAIVGGLIASFACIILWAAITVLTKYQIGYMAIGVGFVVGLAIQKFGKGMTFQYGILGAVISLITCILGNFTSIVSFHAIAFDYGVLDTFSNLSINECSLILQETFQPMDLFFYAISVYFGFKFSIKTD